MPTFSITGKRQQTITETFITPTDDPAPAIAAFKAKHPGLTGVRPTRKKEVTVITAEPPSSIVLNRRAMIKNKGK